MKKVAFPFLFAALLFFSSCQKDEEANPGRITIHFNHLIDGTNIQYDKMIYTNAAGNQYEVSEIQWFISDVTLVAESGKEYLLDKGGFAHYVDTDVPDTWSWNLPDDIPAGSYKAIKVTFGIKGEKNIPYYFVNPPESDMLWPYQLGGDNGGYHYMKLNGFWKNTESQRMPFNLHLGVGQEYDDDGNITGFVQNWFETTLPNSTFALKAGEEKDINLMMNVESWFDTPNVFDFNKYGGMIMTNEEAMGKISENGKDVFSIEFGESCTSCESF